MAYNGYFPTSYQQYYPQPQYAQPNQQASQGGIIWVQGEAGAKSYMVAPGNTVQLWDSESQTIYLKSADASGMPSMRILDYQIRDNGPSGTILGAKSDFATRGELQSVVEQINALKAQINDLGGRHESPVSADESAK